MKRKNINLIILGFFVLSLLTPVLAADNEVTLHFFYGKGCPHCGSGLDFLSSIKENYPSLVVEEHEVYFNQEERELFEKMTEAFEEKIEGVPTTFVDNKILVGFSNTIANSIEEEIKRCLEIGCEDPINKIKDDETIKLTGDSSPSVDPEKTETIKKLTIPAVLFAALVDAINPCAFAVLIILMSTILGSKNRKKE